MGTAVICPFVSRGILYHDLCPHREIEPACRNLGNYCQYSGRDSKCLPILEQCRYTILPCRNLELILQVHRLDFMSLWALFNFASKTLHSLAGVNCLGPFSIVPVSLRANMLHIRLVNRVNPSALNMEAANTSDTLVPIFTASCRRR
jgi:hypothetical protein